MRTKAKPYAFNAMAVSGNTTPGTPGWSARLGMRLQYQFEGMVDQGAGPVVDTLREILEDKPWKRFPPEHPVKRADAYCLLVLGVDWDEVLPHVLAIDKSLHDSLKEEVYPKKGNYQGSGTNNISTRTEHPELQHGTSAAYTRNRLKRERPDLYDQVRAGELSANKAAIEAGWRKRTMQVPADDSQAALSKINSHYGTEYQ